MNGSALKRAMGCVAFSLALFPLAVAEAHLFHKVFEVPENQLTKDYWVLVQLIEFPNERFDLAAEVYRGEVRVRLKPGGYRKWLKRPIEPGMVYRADYQLKRWTGTLAAEVQRLDHTYGTALQQGIEEGLSTRHAEAVKQAFQQLFFYLIRELSEAIWENLHNPEAPLQLYQFLFRYFSVGLEAFLAINHRIDYLVLRTTIEAVERSLGDPSRDLPPSPEMYQHHQTRFLRVLAQALRIPPSALSPWEKASSSALSQRSRHYSHFSSPLVGIGARIGRCALGEDWMPACAGMTNAASFPRKRESSRPW